ncbi:DoxX family protein [Leptospira fainei serovar Hurstbridge str. BUT 6]|uniref:DoxX family protein n=1 Tax=Leptospira fainei serovar Hurstbridge str. BUT 6 TaxID=1193011 RepID=S3UYP9_9LEPT|nr:DoxX family membrane protein [Leptospira fainei]EPG73479.1 DoxX family protein [Leptospira fainei serovar Hurstbridge str. BUT 6]
MKLFTFSVHVLFGGIFLLFGLSKFYPFMPIPPMNPQAANFIAALIGTGYLWYLIGAIETIAGLMVILRRKVPLALLILAPIITNIVFYLLILQRGIGFLPIAMSIFLVFSEGYLIYLYRNSYKSIIFEPEKS